MDGEGLNTGWRRGGEARTGTEVHMEGRDPSPFLYTPAHHPSSMAGVFFPVKLNLRGDMDLRNQIQQKPGLR